MILLDATKAFDRVHYVKLFSILRERNLCPLLCRFLALQYSMQQCRVKWANSVSDIFQATNGVKQGGVLSPVLFTIYMDCLLKELRDSGVGCHIGNVFTGALGYADDLILLTPTKHSMNILLKICESFSKQFNILFNAGKSKHIFFTTSNSLQPTSFVLDGNIIPTVDSDNHLGNIIRNCTLSKSIEYSIRMLTYCYLNFQVPILIQNTHFLKLFACRYMGVNYGILKIHIVINFLQHGVNVFAIF